MCWRRRRKRSSRSSGISRDSARLAGSVSPRQVRGGVNPEAFELKKMGAALISFPKAARAGAGALQWLVPPRILRAAQ